jgi:hypothetical protein
MKTVVRLLLLVAGLLAAPGLPAAEIHLDQEIDAIPATFSDMYICGHWKNDEGEGVYRVIYAEFYFGNSLLYIQWLKDFTLEQPSRKVLHTVSIAEFNANDHIELMFDKPQCIPTSTGIQFNVHADSGQDGKAHVFELSVAHDFGDYQISEVTAP